MHPILQRLKERKLVQWGLAYLAGAWVLYQGLEAFGEPWGVTDSLLRATQVVLVVGFLATLVVAWYHGEQGHRGVPRAELAILVGLLVLAIAGGSDVATAGGEGGTLGPNGGGADSPEAEWVVLHREDFSTLRRAGWNANRNVPGAVEVTDGEYVWDIRWTEDRFHSEVAAGVAAVADFDLSVDVQFSGQDTLDIAGLTFGGAGDRYYAFRVDRGGYRALQRRSAQAQQWDTLLRWDAIAGGVGDRVRLRVTMVGDLGTFYVDGRRVAQLRVPEYAGGTVGLTAAPGPDRKIRVVFDDFEVRGPALEG